MFLVGSSSLYSGFLSPKPYIEKGDAFRGCAWPGDAHSVFIEPEKNEKSEARESLRRTFREQAWSRARRNRQSRDTDVP